PTSFPKLNAWGALGALQLRKRGMLANNIHNFMIEEFELFN
ncbi:hypothetical protein M092_4815, partial [Parabacteroides distasonis str. 3776 D15 iv]